MEKEKGELRFITTDNALATGAKLLTIAEAYDLFMAEAKRREQGVKPAPLPEVPATTAPVQPEPVKRTYKELITHLFGSKGNSFIYGAKAGDFYYQVFEEKYVVPRGTNLDFDLLPNVVNRLSGNDSPVPGGQGVPQNYTLPEGWDWMTFSDDGAFYIVPYKTGNAGPAWLQSGSSAPAPTKAPEQPAIDAVQPDALPQNTPWSYNNDLTA